MKQNDLFYPHVKPIRYVRFKHPNEGWDHDIETAKKHLQFMKVYEVERVLEYSWYTDVYLQEFPGIKFNLVNFEVVNDSS